MRTMRSFHHQLLSALMGALLGLGATSPRSVHAEEWLYTVQPGDNIWSVTERYLTSLGLWPKLQALNQVADPLHLPPGSQLRIPVAWLRSVPFLARVDAVQGEAEVLEDGAEPGKPLAAGALLASGDSVRTGRDANVTLAFVDGSRVLLQAEGQVTLKGVGVYGSTGMTDTRLHLTKGRLETLVAPRRGPATRFEISTPAAVTSVRGTDYRVSTEEARVESRAEVLRGKVNVDSAGATRTLRAGFGTVATADEAPLPPIKLLEAPDVSALPAEFDRVPMQVALPAQTGARGYRLQIAASEAFAPLLFDRRYEAAPLRGPDLPDGEYVLRVRGIDQYGLEGVNGERRFLLNARPEAPFPIEPKAGAGIAEETPGFAWSRVQSIEKYHLQIARDAKFAELLLDVPDLAESRLTITMKLPLGTYFWRVASVDAKEGRGPFSDPQEFRRVPPAPQAEAPEIGDDTMDIRWRAGLPGQKYQLQMAEDADFTKPLVDTRTDKPELRMPKPSAGTYYLRIRTIDPDGFEGPFGTPQTIEVPRSPYWWLLLLPLFALIAI
jgi:hypothetical protein